MSTIFVLHQIETSSLRDTVNLSFVALPHARFDACNQSNAMKSFRSGTMPIWRMLSHAPPLVVDGVWLKLLNYPPSGSEYQSVIIASTLCCVIKINIYIYVLLNWKFKLHLFIYGVLNLWFGKIAEWSGECALQGGWIHCFGRGCDHGFGVLERRQRWQCCNVVLYYFNLFTLFCPLFITDLELNIYLPFVFLLLFLLFYWLLVVVPCGSVRLYSLLLKTHHQFTAFVVFWQFGDLL